MPLEHILPSVVRIAVPRVPPEPFSLTQVLLVALLVVRDRIQVRARRAARHALRDRILRRELVTAQRALQAPIPPFLDRLAVPIALLERIQ